MTRTQRAILILGGGTMQIPALQAARGLGLQVHMADGNASCPGRADADVFHHVDLRDREGLLASARQIDRLAGVFTAGTDFSSSVAWVAQALGLPGIPYETSLDATDKGRMRRRLESGGVPIPQYTVVRQNESADRAMDRCRRTFSLPVVCKPVDNMGARGVRQVDRWDELTPAVAAARETSVGGDVIVEERIPGREFSLDALVIDGRIEVTGVADRHVFFPPWFVELGHTIPTALDARRQAILEATFRDAIRALGINRGAAKGDVFLVEEQDGPRAVVGEIAARLSGGYMSGWTYPRATGIPLTELAIRIAIGENPAPEHFRPRRQRVSAERAVISAPGRVERVVVPDDALQPEEALFLRCAPGDRVAPPTNNVEKVANVITVADSRTAAEDRAQQLIGQVEVHLTPGDPESDRFMFQDGWRSRFASFGVDDGDGAAIAARPGAGAELHLIAATMGKGPLPVRDLPVKLRRSIRPRHIVLAPDELLATAEERGMIRWEDGATAVDGFFWRAFLAAGLQGIVYVRATVAAEGTAP